MALWRGGGDRVASTRRNDRHLRGYCLAAPACPAAAVLAPARLASDRRACAERTAGCPCRACTRVARRVVLFEAAGGWRRHAAGRCLPGSGGRRCGPLRVCSWSLPPTPSALEPPDALRVRTPRPRCSAMPPSPTYKVAALPPPAPTVPQRKARSNSADRGRARNAMPHHGAGIL